MRVHICAVGRMRPGPERELTDDYLVRFDRTGGAIGLGPATLHEVEDKKGGGMRAEATLLRKALPKSSLMVTLDERGKLLSSPDFATLLAGWRDEARGDLSFVIGGADGIDPILRRDAEASVSFGKMVWPHMLVRIMLAEQLYRAAAILTGAPYHRV